MKVTVSLKQMKNSQTLIQKIEERSLRLKHHFSGRVEIKWTCYEKDGVFFSMAHLIGPKTNYHAKGEHTSMISSVENVLEKLDKQITKNEHKRKDRIHKGPMPEILDPEAAWLLQEDDDENIAS